MAVKRLLSLQLVTVLALTVLVVGGSRLGVPARSAPVPFEVWLIDQSDTTGLPYGGTLRIYSGADVTGSNPSAAAPTDVIDLGAETAALCRATTGADPVRPHMVTFNNADTHAAIAFVASGHVAILDAVTRRPLACVRTEAGAGGARQAHALWPTEDDRYLVVANQNGKKLERIRTDYAANAFVQEPEATLDLANCTTPNGLPCQAPETRPDNAPICPFIASDNGPVFVSLRGGGLFAVDWRTTPMPIVAEYDRDNIPANGCGFIEARGMVFGDGGGGTAANLDQFSVWRLPMTGYSASNPPNIPRVERLFDDDSPGRDAHGNETTRMERYVWTADRAANVVEVFDAVTGVRVATVGLTSRFSADPTPDLFAISPDRKWFFLSTRGPNPLSGDPHASQGTDPGMLIVRLSDPATSGEVRGLVRISNLDAAGVERADAHGIRMRRT
ncbi:MAG TPA: hypothetical protein VFH23_10795 [Jiangellaceae bacterium]|nr:hypothetical protein [Jiangellaceae bacterium]